MVRHITQCDPERALKLIKYAYDSDSPFFIITVKHRSLKNFIDTIKQNVRYYHLDITRDSDDDSSMVENIDTFTLFFKKKNETQPVNEDTEYP